MSLALVNGTLGPLDEAMIPVTDTGFLSGWTVFETLRVVDRSIPLLEEHLERLACSASAAEIHLPPEVEEEVVRLASHSDGEGRIRITLSGSGARVLTLVPVPRDRRGAPVRCATGPFVADPFLDGSVKHGSRAGWIVAVRQAGVDDILLVDEAGRLTEGTTCGVIAVLDGVLWTAPHDSRILQSTTVNDALEVAGRLGIPIHREGPLADSAFDGLYMASATRGLAPVVELDGRPLPGWEPIGRSVFEGMP